MIRLTLLLLIYGLLASSYSHANSNKSYPQQNTNNGAVSIPLATYNEFIEQGRDIVEAAPASYAMAPATVRIKVNENNDNFTADVNIKMHIETFEDKWSLIPIIPVGAAITRVKIDGKYIQLVQGSEWLLWPKQKSGRVELSLDYTIDASRSDQGYTLAVPMPKSSASDLGVDFPAKDIDVAIVPATNIKTSNRNKSTKITASIPATSALQISWTKPSEKEYVINRADYKGKFNNNALTFTADYDVEILSGSTIKLPIISNQTTLMAVNVDEKEATIIEEDSQFNVLVSGRGKHKVKVEFESAIIQKNGPPSVSLNIPKVPISKFTLQIPGNKDLQVSPTTSVRSNFKNNQTNATVFLPLSDNVTFSWSDAIPVDVLAKFRANAIIYHALYAEEGVIHGRAVIDYNVTHGETSSLSFSLPESAQVNLVESSMKGISDWTETEDSKTKTNLITVFFDRPIKKSYQLSVLYEQLIASKPSPSPSIEADPKQAIILPLLTAADMHRQRGVVALLVGNELSMTPVLEEKVTRVGENQLPAFFKNKINLTIAHTYKYSNSAASISVNTVAPERQQGKFNAQVDTLISLAEVTLHGSASVHIDVKSGSLIDLELKLPLNINVLNVSGPSLRSFKVNPDGDRQTIAVEFTQEISGQFRLDVSYEKILGDSISEIYVATIDAPDAEVERGRIAVEALTSVEVQAGKTEQLSSLEVSELPKQLVLKNNQPNLTGV